MIPFASTLTAIHEIADARIRERDSHRLLLNQQLRLRRLLAHTLETVPFYRERRSESPGLLGADQWQRVFRELPILTRTDLTIQPRSRLLSSLPIGTASLHSTSGTTTRPRVFARDATTGVFNSITVDRYLRRHGVPLLSTILFLYTRRSPRIDRVFMPFERCSYRVYASLPYLVDNPQKSSLLGAQVVVGSPQQLEVFTALLVSTGKIPPPTILVSIAERLDPATRARLERLSGARVVDVYCSSEASTLIGFECPDRVGFHVNSDFMLVELVDQQGHPVSPGSIGNIVITDLCNYVSPILRYSIGDVAVRSRETRCKCGCSLPVQLTEIAGRRTDQVLLPDHKSLHATPLLDRLGAQVRAPFTLTQLSSSEFRLTIFRVGWCAGEYSTSQLANTMSDVLGSRCLLTVQYGDLAEQLPNESGKFRAFVSAIPRIENSHLGDGTDSLC